MAPEVASAGQRIRLIARCPLAPFPAYPVYTGTAPAGAHHYAIAKGATTVRVTFMGPYIITYLNNHDAPRSPVFPFQY